MNYLALCQRTRHKCGIQGDGPTAVTRQSGILKYVVDAVAAAWREIQTESDAWNFMWARFEFATTDGSRDYSLADMQIDRLAEQSITCYDITETESEEWRLTYKPYFAFSQQFDLGTVETGKPQYVTVTPDGSIRVYPTPDSADYRVQGDYYSQVVELAANTDVPVLPSKFHDAIVYKAMMDVGAYIGAAEVVQMGEVQYKAMLRKMYRDEAPAVQLRMRPLA